MTFKQLFSALCVALAALSIAAPAQAVVKKKAVAKKAPAPVVEEGTLWTCAEGVSFRLKGDVATFPAVTLFMKGKKYNLARVITTTGAGRFKDDISGMDLVTIPAKAMLFNRKQGARLGDECKTAEMAKQAPVASSLDLPASN